LCFGNAPLGRVTLAHRSGRRESDGGLGMRGQSTENPRCGAVPQFGEGLALLGVLDEAIHHLGGSFVVRLIPEGGRSWSKFPAVLGAQMAGNNDGLPQCLAGLCLFG
jgi:hypothetical protein